MSADVETTDTAPPSSAPALVHQPATQRELVARPLIERILDRALQLAVQVGMLKTQVAMLTRGLQEAQRKLDTPRAHVLSVEQLHLLFGYVQHDPINAVRSIRAMTGCDLKVAKEIVDSARRSRPLTVQS